MNILFISPDFNYACGVSKHIFELLKHYDSLTQYNVFFITNGGDALVKLESSSINYRLLHFEKGWKNLLYFPFNYFYIKKYCVKNKIDIIHTHHRYPEFLSNFLKGQLEIKTITTAHSFVIGYKHLSFKSEKIVAVSKSVSTYITRHYPISKDKIKTLYNCIPYIDESTYNRSENLMRKLNLDEQIFKVLYSGRINRVKGSDILIGAFSKLEKLIPRIKLILIGNVSDKKDLIKINTNIENIISISRQDDISAYYSICDLVILPSRIEALGYTMLEAGYFKKPFIGSRTGGIAEFIDDGVNGFLFEPGNVDDLADKIRFIINNPEKAKSAAEELNKKVIKYCNCEKYFDKLTNIYNELLNE